MQTLKLADDLFPLLDAGTKRGTVRSGKRDISPGWLRLEAVSGNRHRDVEVRRVSWLRAGDMTQTDAEMDGADSPGALFDALQRFYPDLTGCDIVTVIEFDAA